MESEPSTATKQNESPPPKVQLPFKLYFPVKEQLGRSNKKYRVDVLAPKFYSRAYRDFTCPESNLRKTIKKLESVGPHEKYKRHITENQRYGWYKVNLNPRDKYFNYRKCTHELVKEHLMNYEKIRE